MQGGCPLLADWGVGRSAPPHPLDPTTPTHLASPPNSKPSRPRKGEHPKCLAHTSKHGGGGGKTLALALTAALAIIAGLFSLSGAGEAQNEDEQTGRIVARRLDDGRTEFGWQPSGGERVLPRLRYFPADVDHQRWLNSSPVEVAGEAIGRINVRLSEDGRIEFAFTPTDGERIEPSARYFPADARVGRWLRSTEISISAAPAAGFIAVSAGGGYTCAIRTNGEITCWGWNINRETDAPAGSFGAVSAGSHACAIRTNGEIVCWGRNHDSYGNYGGQTDAPAGRFSAVSAGGWHTCGLRESGEIECWGANEYGKTDAPAGRFIAVNASSHTCAIRESGEITCWGSNDRGRLNAPAGPFSAVSVGGGRTCGLRESGEIECWGANEYGQADAPEGRFLAVSAGGSHTCGLRENGAIECWGNNEYGQLDVPAP